jgi:hypothetical protein
MAAQNATFVFVAADGSETYTVDAYVPDAIATKILFASVGLSGTSSQDYWKAPKNVYLVDISGAAPTAVGATITLSGVPYTNKTFRWANQLATLSTRMKHKIFIPAGEQVGALQF